MRPSIISILLRIGLIFSLLFSAAEVSRVGLFVAASFAETDCGNILCTCGTSCVCGDGNHARSAKNAAGIPQIFDTDEEEEPASCCPSGEEEPAEGATSSHAEPMRPDNETAVCGCGQLPGDEGSGLIKPLEKTVLLSGPTALPPQTHRFLKYAFISAAHPAFPDEVFHPPRQF